MAVIHEDKDRKIVPRWHVFSSARLAGETTPLHGREEVLGERQRELDIRRQEWYENKSLSFAADVLGAGIALGETCELGEVAEFIITSKVKKPKSLVKLARKVMGVKEDVEELEEEIGAVKDDRDIVAAEIHTLRVDLQDEPRNALKWVNLSWLYAVLGQLEQAARGMEIAITLAPNDRFVLRCAGRLFLHKEEYRRAHNLLKGHPRIKHDPWLLSAEIAFAAVAGRTSRFVKSAREILGSERFAPFHLSELASAMSTLEFEAGKAKFGRKHLVQSLAQPTENAIAQAAWIARQFSEVKVEGARRVWAISHEAGACQAWRECKWKDAVKGSWAWLQDQRFSSRPAILGSYVAAVILFDFDESARIARAGLLANPHDFTLVNNYVFALAQSDHVEEAISVFAGINTRCLSNEDTIVWAATKGLLEYRGGNPTAGRRLYRQAIEDAEHCRNYKRRALAYLWCAREEIRSNTPEARKIGREALETAKGVVFADMVPLRRDVERGMEKDAQEGDK